MTTTITRSSMEEALEEWFGSNSLELKTIDVERDDEYDHPHLYKAVGEFHPVLFDKAYVDNRFDNTKLIFPTDTTFKIV